MDAHSQVTRLAADLGLAALPVDGNGETALQVGSRLIGVTIDRSSRWIFLSTAVGALSRAGPRDGLRDVLARNVELVDEGLALGFDPGTAELLLSLRVHAGTLEPGGARAAIERFVARAAEIEESLRPR